jgi:hypothetical protein
MEIIVIALIENWEVIGLILTNIGALFIKPPRLRKK